MPFGLGAFEPTLQHVCDAPFEELRSSMYLLAFFDRPCKKITFIKIYKSV
jgi:hypothetical protein